MADPVPPFRIVIPSVQILALTLAVLWFVIGLDYAEDSMFNNLFVPVLGFLLWGGAQSWIVVGMMKQHYTIPVNITVRFYGRYPRCTPGWLLPSTNSTNPLTR